jgi:hypothetical protein
MKPIPLLFGLVGLMIACSPLPKVLPVDGSALPDHQQECRRPFPDGKWQLLHSIEATLPGGAKGWVMGVTIISSPGRTAHCIIMTIEGLVVFDAQYDRQLVVNRGVPPFDTDDFAEGLIQDIRLIFFPPEGPLTEAGILKNGSFVCRHQNPDGQIVDVISGKEKGWELRQYGKDLGLNRTVRAFFNKDSGDSARLGMPARLELTAHDSPGYALTMDLLEAVPLNP